MPLTPAELEDRVQRILATMNEWERRKQARRPPEMPPHVARQHPTARAQDERAELFGGA